MKFHQAIELSQRNRRRRTFPNASDVRSRLGSLFPDFTPKFTIDLDNLKVFTIGSCFARNIEEVLSPLGVNVPTMTFSTPKSEWPHRPNGLLNEFSPATISQRILHALEGKPYPVETIVPSGDLYADLLLLGGSTVTLDRAIERRNEISQIYSHLNTADVLIVTLGLIETWFDEETGYFLNQMPPPPFARKHPDRFKIKRLEPFDCSTMMDEALTAVTKRGIKVILTVSPVPLRSTFFGDDCVVANEYSKSVLRVSASRAARGPSIDYFPSYEIVRSGGLANYMPDCVHVKGGVVKEVTHFMIEKYSTDKTETASSSAKLPLRQ